MIALSNIAMHWPFIQILLPMHLLRMLSLQIVISFFCHTSAGGEGGKSLFVSFSPKVVVFFYYLPAQINAYRRREKE